MSTLVRQLSEDVTVFASGAGRLTDDDIARLSARGIRIVDDPLERVRREGDGLVAVTRGGTEHLLDALFTGTTPVIDLGFADSLALARAEEPGAPVIVDARGATSHPRVFAAGNITAPFANVPVSMGAGSMAGAAANAMLASEDTDRAVAEQTALRNTRWEERYAAEEKFWSGRVNHAVATVAATLEPGTALDVGSGEGGDVVWLAEHGWDATGLDVSPTAVRRATELAAQRGVRARFVVGDGAASADGTFDLVLASFLHSWEADFPRLRILREAADHVAPGGRLLVVSHAAPPPWARDHDHAARMWTPAEELALLDLDPALWTPEIVEVRPRPVQAPDGTPSTLDDGILLLRRAG